MNYAKRIPPERALSWDSMREAVLRFADEIPALDETVREEVGIPPNNFEFETEEMTEEEKTELKEKIETDVQEWMKKNKKKPKTEEEDKEDLDQMHLKMSDGL